MPIMTRNGKVTSPCPHRTLGAFRAWASKRWPEEPKSKWQQIKNIKVFYAMWYNN